VPERDDDVTVSRPASPALEAILGRPFPVLDDGFVRVVDYMGDDSAIVQAARVSYGAGTKIVREDRGLIRYLLRHRHTTPFEMCEIKLHVRVPMDTWRQWIRHRTANVNEYSTRYSIAIDSAQRTPPSEWRVQAKANRQGSEGVLPAETGEYLSERERVFHEAARALYEERLSRGVAREQARKDLPLSTFTEAYWKIDLHNLLHFLSLRMDDNAQFEIRQYAGVIGNNIVAAWVPMTWEAFVAYRLRSVTFSATELDVLRLSDTREPVQPALSQLLASIGWLERDTSGKLKANRERTEFVEKYRRLYGARPTWLT
jgi:thymidylate synthase (FAD)